MQCINGPRTSAAGFSLVELSIVLVIIGLLVGGVLTGQSLIRSSEIKSTIATIQNYQTAIRGFQDKYGALPGDLTTATDYWGLAGGTTAPNNNTCFFAQTASSTATCNGNGDGMIAWDYTNFNEGTTAWKQLSNAGLVPGSFNGKGVGGSPQVIDPPNNSPPFKLSPKYGWWITGYWWYSGGYWDGTQFDHTASGTTLSLNKGGTNYSALSSEAAYQIDVKMDDGRPAFGDVFTWRSAPNCINNAGNWVSNGSPIPDEQVVYNRTDTPNMCDIHIIIDR